VLVMSAP